MKRGGVTRGVRRSSTLRRGTSVSRSWRSGSSADLLDDDTKRLQKRMSDVAAAQVHDDTLGGLLNEDGEDVRRVQKDVPLEELQRRKGEWRGMSLSPNASLQWDFAVATFEYKVEAMVLSSSLVVYLLFIVAFCFFFLVGRNISDNYFLQKVFSDTLVGSEIAKLRVHRYFPDISESSQFVDHICDVLLVQLIDLTYPTGGNLLLGAMRFRTQRMRSDSCSVNPSVVPTSMPSIFQECYGVYSSSMQDTGYVNNPYNKVPFWTYKSCTEIGSGSDITGQMGTYDCGGYIFELPFWRDMEPENNSTLFDLPPFPFQAKERVPLLVSLYEYVYPPLVQSDPPFLDNYATRLAVTELFAFNPSLRTFLSVKLIGEVAPGGFWFTATQLRIFSVWTKEDLPKSIYDIFFFVFVVYYLYQLGMDFARFYRRERKILAFFFDMWVLLELSNLAILITVGAFRIMYVQRCLSADIMISDLTYSPTYPVVLDDILQSYMMQVYLNSINTVLIFLKLLKFLRLNDRLNILTRTLSASQDSIVGVLIIFLLVVSAYAMTGYGLFGLGVWAFRSVDASFSTLLQMLVGVIDYESLKNENRIQAGFFFWSYQILVLFCLLNFLIGVLMEAFGEVSNMRPLLPLETVLAKTWDDWKRILQPKNLIHSLVQTLKGNTKSVLLADAVEMLREYREEKYPSDDVIQIEMQVMNLDDFETAIDDELAEKVGKAYLAYIWDDLVYEWDRSKEADAAITKHHEMKMTTRGVKQAIGDQMKKIERFGPRMLELEKQLDKLAGLLQGRDITSMT
jgi:hypothetical protein